MTEEKKPEYLLGEVEREAERLNKQYDWVQFCLKSQIVFAPIDMKKPGLKAIDVGCAEGK